MTAAAIVAGNERVLRARLWDAQFFWDQDRKRPLASRVPELDGVVFHARLGSLGDKAARLQSLAGWLAERVPDARVEQAARAALLCKADLVTGMVGEFPELQGVMGRYYALHDREHADVAAAIARALLAAGAERRLPERAGQRRPWLCRPARHARPASSRSATSRPARRIPTRSAGPRSA